jgi:hypothetical protein
MTIPTSMLSRFFIMIIFLLSADLSVLAGPGAHGPGGEHLDQAPGAAATRAATPRFEAATDVFELVAVLAGGELSLLIDRFDTNAPVLDARVEVESGGKKAHARFHADHGDYAVDDPTLLATLSQPGEHAVVISVVAGESSDLLNGTLAVAGAATQTAALGHAHGEDDHDRAFELALVIGAGVVIAMLLVVLGCRWRRRRRASTAVQEVRT